MDICFLPLRKAFRGNSSSVLPAPPRAKKNRKNRQFEKAYESARHGERGGVRQRPPGEEQVEPRQSENIVYFAVSLSEARRSVSDCNVQRFLCGSLSILVFRRFPMSRDRKKGSMDRVVSHRSMQWISASYFVGVVGVGRDVILFRFAPEFSLGVDQEDLGGGDADGRVGQGVAVAVAVSRLNLGLRSN